MAPSQSTQFKPKPKPPTMNCATCNFPHPPHELRDGKCLGCLATAYTFSELKLITAEQDLARVQAQAEKAEALVASYDRQDEVIGPEFEGVDEVTEVIRLLKSERDLLASRAAEMRVALQLAVVPSVKCDDGMPSTHVWLPPGSRSAIIKALSTDAGRGWASPEDVKVLVDAIHIYLHEHGPVDCESCQERMKKALAHAKVKGLTQ